MSKDLVNQCGLARLTRTGDDGEPLRLFAQAVEQRGDLGSFIGCHNGILWY